MEKKTPSIERVFGCTVGLYDQTPDIRKALSLTDVVVSFGERAIYSRDYVSDEKMTALQFFYLSRPLTLGKA